MRGEADRLAGRVRALLTLAFTSESEHESVAAFRKARELNRRLEALPPEEDTAVRIQAAMLALDGELARESLTRRGKRLAEGSSLPVEFAPVATPTDPFEARATQPSVPAQGYHALVGED